VRPVQDTKPGLHLWCKLSAILESVARELLPEQDARPVVLALWETASRELSCCSACVAAYHAAEVLHQSRAVTQSSAEEPVSCICSVAWAPRPAPTDKGAAQACWRAPASGAKYAPAAAAAAAALDEERLTVVFRAVAAGERLAGCLCWPGP